MDISSIDTNSMDIVELKQLKRSLDIAIDGFAKRQMRIALQEIEAVAKKHGLTLDDISNARKFSVEKKKRKGSHQYKNPKDPAVIWSGMGRQPRWFNDALAEGLSKEDMRIK